MKRCCVRTLACLFVLAVAQPAAAQALGIKFGVNLSNLAVSPDDALGDVGAKAGILGGGFFTMGEGKRLVVEAGAQVALRRIAFGPDIEDTLTYLEIPVVVRYRVFRRNTLTVSALGGGSLDYLIDARESVLGESTSVKDAHEAFDVAALIGGHASWNDRWSVEARYLFGFSETYVEPAFDTQSRQRGLQFLVGYRFR